MSEIVYNCRVGHGYILNNLQRTNLELTYISCLFLRILSSCQTQHLIISTSQHLNITTAQHLIISTSQHLIISTSLTSPSVPSVSAGRAPLAPAGQEGPLTARERFLASQTLYSSPTALLALHFHKKLFSLAGSFVPSFLKLCWPTRGRRGTTLVDHVFFFIFYLYPFIASQLPCCSCGLFRCC